MKKFAIIAIAALVVLAGCASTEPTISGENKTVASPVGQVLGLNGVPMPDWVYADQSTQDVHFAVGYAKMSNQMNSMKRAQAEARNVIAEWVMTAVDEIITTYTNDAGSNMNRQAMDAFETVAKQRAQALLSGSMQEDMWIDAEGGVYVLVGIPVENVADQMYGAVSDAIAQTQTAFVKNEAAEEANAMMDAAISKYFGSVSVTE